MGKLISVKDCKFDIGDCVYTIIYTTESVYTKCKVCNGTIKIKCADRESYDCPACAQMPQAKSGYFSKEGPRQWYVNKENDGSFKKGNVIGINIGFDSWPKGGYIKLLLSYTSFEQKDCFYTVKEAQAECDKRNKKLHSKHK